MITPRRVVVELTAIAVLGLVLIPFAGDNPYILTVGILTLIYAIQGVGLNLIWGIAGQFSMAQPGLMALSAYVSVEGYSHLIPNFWISAAAGIASALLASAVIGVVALPLREMHFAIVTLAFTLLFGAIVGSSPGLGGTGGLVVPYSLPHLPLDSVGFGDVSPNVSSFILVLAVTICLLAVQGALLQTRLGRAFIAIREDETLAAAVGIDVRRYKVYAFVISTVAPAIDGIIFAGFITYISPDQFEFAALVNSVLVVAVGGLGSLSGPILGSIIFTAVPELLRWAGELRLGIYGAALIVIVILAPGGILGWINALVRRLLPGSAPIALGSKERTPTPEPSDPRIPTELLGVEHLEKHFRGVKAVRSFSVSIQEGQIVGLIGPNGAGKTTVFNLVSGFTKPDEGVMRWRGRQVGFRKPADWARHGLVRTFQTTRVFPNLTVRENLLLACHTSDKGQAMARLADELLDLLALSQLRNRRAGDLPYGTARMLSVGIALASRPSLLLLDEPAAGLNSRESDQLASILKELQRRSMSLWVIEHDMAFVMGLCDRVVVMSAGATIADAPPSVVRADPIVQEAYLGTEAEASA